MAKYPNNKSGGQQKVFGQSMRKKSSSSNRYQRQLGGGGGGRGGGGGGGNMPDVEESENAKIAAFKRLRQEQGEAIDVKFGYNRLEDQEMDGVVVRRGWLFHMLHTTVSLLFFYLEGRIHHQCFSLAEYNISSGYFY
jgi:hypothetical protein